MLKTEMTRDEVYKELAIKFKKQAPKRMHITQPNGTMLGTVYCVWGDWHHEEFKIRNKNGEFILVE